MTSSNNQTADVHAHQPVGKGAALVGSVIAALVLVALAHFAYLYDWVKAPDAWAYDWRTAHFSLQPESTRKDILVVTIDETSLEQYPWNSPVNRSLAAELVQGLEAAGARAIGLDFLYDKATEPSDDAALISALQASRIPVILGAVDKRSVLRDRDPGKALAFQEEFLTKSDKPAGHLYFFSAERKGRFNVGDRVIRRRIGPSPLSPNRKAFATLLVEKASGLKNLPAVTEPQLIDWQRAPLRGLEQYPVPELRVKSHVPRASIDTMFGDGWRDLVHGRIVLVGGSFGDRDRHLTPFSVIDRKTMPGVFIHAQVVAQLIDGREVLTVPIWLEALVLGALVLAGWWLARRRWSPHATSALEYRLDADGIAETILGGFAVFLGGVSVYATTGYIIPSTTIFLAFLMGLLLGNPPYWLVWMFKRFGVGGAWGG